MADVSNEEELQEKLHDFYEEQSRQVKVEQRSVDFQINNLAEGMLKVYFIISGLLSCVALAFCALGVMHYYTRGKQFEEVTPPGEIVNLDDELLGYDLWQNFSSECCCMHYPNVSVISTGEYDEWVDVEKWVCSNGKMKERQRRVIRGYKSEKAVPESELARIRSNDGSASFKDWNERADFMIDLSPYQGLVTVLSGYPFRLPCNREFRRPTCQPVFDAENNSVLLPEGCTSDSYIPFGLINESVHFW